jgi:hypothetical protein
LGADTENEKAEAERALMGRGGGIPGAFVNARDVRLKSQLLAEWGGVNWRGTAAANERVFAKPEARHDCLWR